MLDPEDAIRREQDKKGPLPEDDPLVKEYEVLGSNLVYVATQTPEALVGLLREVCQDRERKMEEEIKDVENRYDLQRKWFMEAKKFIKEHGLVERFSRE